MFDLTGKTALVTGAARGIGKAIAQTLEKMGARVIGTATTPEGAKAIGGKVLDVSDRASIKKLMGEIGGVDILVNNAGIARDNLLLRMKEEDWDKVIQTDLSSVYSLTKACLKHMLKARFGRIISISSVTAMMGNPGQTNYGAAKAGIIGFTKALAPELAQRGITVNVVAPGMINTEMTQKITPAQAAWALNKIPMERLGTPEEVAAAVAFLASREASYITGETLQVNGGMYMQ